MANNVDIALSDRDIEPLKRIHNDAAGKGKHLRRAKEVRKVYEAAMRVDSAGVSRYITERDAPAVEDRVYGGHQPREQEAARLYLKHLFDTGALDELWAIWRQLCTNEQRSTLCWPHPCLKDPILTHVRKNANAADKE